ncbi:AraC family transcriptional regulator [Mycolicibacterium sp. 624]|uniref:AraC family transcriptional regulator n=1 Tax=Mycolicibacterium sp. 624 TaxID=3156314 RepID=UPI00339853BE
MSPVAADGQGGLGADPTLHAATIAPSVILALVEVAEDHGVDTEAWFAGTGLSRRQLELPETRLSYRQIIVHLRRAFRDLPPGPLGLHLGSRNAVASWGLLGFAIHSCRDVAEAIDVGTRLHRAAGSLLDVEANFSPNDITFELRERWPVPDLLQFMAEEASSAIVTLTRSVLGMHAGPIQVEFCYTAPLYADAYQDFFRCPVLFGTAATRIRFEGTLRNHVISTGNRTQLAAAMDGVEKLACADRRQVGIAAQVEDVLRENLQRPLTMAAIAARLAMSERTLHRRLARERRTFGEVRDKVRCQRAAHLLRLSSMPIIGVAAEVGYSDVREFRRAYRRWTGRTPSAERTDASSGSRPGIIS